MPGMDFGGMMGGGGNPYGMIAQKIIGGIQNAAGGAGKPMAPEDFARLQGNIVGGEAPAAQPAAPAPAQKQSGGGGGGGFMGMLGKGVGNLDTTGGSNFLEQAKNLIGGMFQ